MINQINQNFVIPNAYNVQNRVQKRFCSHSLPSYQDSISFKSKYLPANDSHNLRVLKGIESHLSVLTKKITKFIKGTNFKEYFDNSKYVPARLWQEGKLVNNPACEQYLAELNNLNPKEKERFVKEFCDRTGFPDLKIIQTKIDSELKNSITNTLDEYGYKPAFIGYSSVSSAGKGLAIPGSDCDGLFVLVDKPIDYSKLYRNIIGDNINQRLTDTTGMHFPELYSIQEMMEYVRLADSVSKKFLTPRKIQRYKSNILRADKDFVKAGEYNIDLASRIDNVNNKNMVYLTAIFVEELRSGHIVVNNLSQRDLEFIKNSALYKYSNVNRQEAFKDTLKPKLANRIKLCEQFKNMTLDEQFDVCSGIFKSSMGVDINDGRNLNQEFDMGNILDLVRKISNFNV